MLTLFADTDCDITPAVAKKYGCKLISMPFAIDGREIRPYEDNAEFGNDPSEFDIHAFYNKLREGTLPTTSALTEQAYDNYFRPEFEAGNDILYVHFSAEMSCTFDVMEKALDRLRADFPERKFYSIDTKGIAIMGYIIISEVGKMLSCGVSVEEVLAWAEREVDHYAMYFFADDLKFFKRSGRVSGISATMGTLLGIRPIIYMSPEGKMISIGKERGRERAMEKLISYARELGDDVASHKVIVGHTDAPEFANELADMMRAEFGDALDIEIVPTNPTAGSHCGPNGAGICFHALHR